MPLLQELREPGIASKRVKKRRSHEVLFEAVAISIKRPIDNVREEAANPLLFKIRASWSRTVLPGKALGMGLAESSASVTAGI
jgi:hypothetical protein